MTRILWPGLVAGTLVAIMGVTGSYADEAADRIIAVNHERLAAGLLGGLKPMDEKAMLVHPGVARKYTNGGEVVQITVGIYPDVDGARDAMMRSMASVVRSPLFCPADECMLIARSAYLRWRNLVVVVVTETDESAESKTNHLLDIWNSLQEPGVATFGAEVATPEIDMLGVKRDSRSSATFYFQGDGDTVLFEELQKHRDYSVGAEEYVQRVERRLQDHVPMLRLARPTGEVLEVPVHKVKLDNPLPIPPKPKALTGNELDPAERRQLLRELDSGDGTLAEQADWARRLSADPHDDMLPLFLEIIRSDREAVLKKYGLRVLDRLLGAAGGEVYRDVAADGSQPEIVRRDAIRLIGRHGKVTDLPLIEQIRAEGHHPFRKPLRSAERAIQARK